MQDVGGVDEEVGPQEVRGLPRQLGEVLLELPLLVAPGEVRVGLVEADPGQRLHHRRPGERLGEEQHVGVGLADLGEQPLPERRPAWCAGCRRGRSGRRGPSSSGRRAAPRRRCRRGRGRS